MDPLLDMHRRDAIEEFRTTIVIDRPSPSGEPVWDGEKYDFPRVVVYSGPCRMRSQQSNATVVQAGDQPFTLRTYDIGIPPGEPVLLDDRIVVVDSYDPIAAGTKLRVIDVPKTEWLSIRVVVAVEELS